MVSKNKEKRNNNSKSKKSKKNIKLLGYFTIGINYLREQLSDLNNSKYFIGLVILIMNIGSRYVTIKLSKTHEELIKNLITKDLLIFSILFISLRDILLAFLFTAVFKILSDYIFNENSRFCMVPKQYRKIYSAIDENKDGIVDETEIKKAIEILDKAKKQNALTEHKNAMMVFKSSVLK